MRVRETFKIYGRWQHIVGTGGAGLGQLVPAFCGQCVVIDAANEAKNQTEVR